MSFLLTIFSCLVCFIFPLEINFQRKKIQEKKSTPQYIKIKKQSQELFEQFLEGNLELEVKYNLKRGLLD